MGNSRANVTLTLQRNNRDTALTRYLTDTQAHNKIQSHVRKNAKLFKLNCFFFTEKQAAKQTGI